MIIYVRICNGVMRLPISILLVLLARTTEGVLWTTITNLYTDCNQACRQIGSTCIQRAVSQGDSSPWSTPKLGTVNYYGQRASYAIASKSNVAVYVGAQIGYQTYGCCQGSSDGGGCYYWGSCQYATNTPTVWYGTTSCASNMVPIALKESPSAGGGGPVQFLCACAGGAPATPVTQTLSGVPSPNGGYNFAFDSAMNLYVSTPGSGTPVLRYSQSNGYAVVGTNLWYAPPGGACYPLFEHSGNVYCYDTPSSKVLQMS